MKGQPDTVEAGELSGQMVKGAGGGKLEEPQKMMQDEETERVKTAGWGKMMLMDKLSGILSWQRLFCFVVVIPLFMS